VGEHAERRPLVRLAALLALLWAAPVQAECRLALVLALDVSASVDAEEYELQRLGLAAALDARDVRDAILQTPGGHVALAIFEWSGRFQQKVQLDWTVLGSDADIDRAVLALGRAERSYEGYPTSIGQALGYAATLLAAAPDCARRVIDVSGDGVNNYGYGPAEAYRHFPLDGVLVNGLVILGNDPAVEPFYRSEVIRGPGAFVEVVDGFDGYGTAMARKLYREISDIMLGARDRPPRAYAFASPPGTAALHQ
jgi:hypothetical protein